MPALPLLALLALSAAGPEPLVRAACQTYAADPKNPWALAHGLTAFGPGFRASDGRSAAEVIVHDFVKRRDGAPAFDDAAADGTPIDAHPNLLAKTLLLAGVPRSKPFASPSGPVTVDALVAQAERSFRLPPEGSGPAWGELAWTLDVISAASVPGARFRDAAGEEREVDRVMDAALAALERAQEELGAAMDAGKPQVDKRKQGIYAQPCGGLHLIQAVGSWARHKAVRARWGQRLSRQVDILFYRLGSESRQYEAALRELPAYRLQVRAQQLKFYGHLLETLGRLRAEGVFTPTARQSAGVGLLRKQLDLAVEDLERQGAFRAMTQLHTAQPQLYLDLVGDACHALHGMGYWRS